MYKGFFSFAKVRIFFQTARMFKAKTLKNQLFADSLMLVNKRAVCVHNYQKVLARPKNRRTFASSKGTKILATKDNNIIKVGANNTNRITKKKSPE